MRLFRKETLLLANVLTVLAVIGTWVQVILQAKSISLIEKQEDSNRPTKE